MIRNKEELISFLIQSGVLKTRRIVEALRAIDRKDFVRPEYVKEAYADYPLHTGFGQTISQPYTVVFMLELLAPKPGDRILDVGSGSGWTTALLAHSVGAGGMVWGVEIIPDLVKFGKANLAKYSFHNVEIIQAGSKLGLSDQAPFDKILVSAASKELPTELVLQLKVGGTMVVPVGGEIWKVKKISETETIIDKFPGFVFVPLVCNDLIS